MAFSNLIELTEEQYKKLVLIPTGDVNIAKTGAPDPCVGIHLGGWLGNEVLAFTITNAALSASGVSIDTHLTDTLDVEVSESTTPTAMISYYIVNVGEDNRTTNWVVSYEVKKKTKSTGKWVFTKGKSEDDKY